MSMCVCRWWAGQWEACSATCGPHGEKTRTVLCIQTMGSDEQALPAEDCLHLLKPKALMSCNRDILCPSDWTVGNWSEVSAGFKGKLALSISPSHSASVPVTLEKMVRWPASHLWPISCISHCPDFYWLVFCSYRIFLSLVQWSDTCRGRAGSCFTGSHSSVTNGQGFVGLLLTHWQGSGKSYHPESQFVRR